MSDNLDLTKALDERAVAICGKNWYFNGGLDGEPAILDAQYGAVTPIYGPEIPITIREFPNDTDVATSVVYDETRTWASSMSQTLTQSFTVNQSMTIKVPLPFPIPGLAGAEAQNASKFEISKSQTQSSSFNQQLRLTYNIPTIPPRKKTILTVLLTEIMYNVPFTHQVAISGTVDFSTPGFSGPDPHTHVDLGEVFTRFPHPKITVAGPTSIIVVISGTLGAHFGSDRDRYPTTVSNLP
ncbi:hypothetical protein [Paraburkholderia sp. BR14262]